MAQKTFMIQARALRQNLSNLRTQGLIPGIIYGQSLNKAIAMQISLNDLQEIINTENQTIFKLDFNGETYDCILRDFQTDRLHTHIIHVDFQYVKSNEIINMQIPMNYQGLEHLRAKKLILEKAISKIPVRGPVQNLPDTFNYEVGTLDHGFKLFANTINLPANTELLLHPETIVATIQ